MLRVLIAAAFVALGKALEALVEDLGMPASPKSGDYERLRTAN
jgi:hypothetical protein